MQSIDKRYQKLLSELKLYDGDIDGLYGSKSEAAVRKFQEMCGLTADGIIGRNTRAKFEEQLNEIPDRQTEEDVVSYYKWPHETTSDLMRFYGNVGTGQIQMDLPYPMVLAWEKRTTVRHISCHKKVANDLYKALSEVKRIYSDLEIKKHGFNLFGGCLNVRKMRGGDRWSTHSWGIAIDIDPARNSLRTPWKESYLGRPECRDFVEAFKSVGAYSLGLEKNYDPMHFQFAWR